MFNQPVNPLLYYFLEELLKTEKDVISFTRAAEIIQKNKDCKLSAQRITAFLRKINYLEDTTEEGQVLTEEGLKTNFFIPYERQHGGKIKSCCGLTLTGLYYLETNHQKILQTKVRK